VARDISVALTSDRFTSTADRKAQPEANAGYAYFRNWERYHLAHTAEAAFRKTAELADKIGEAPSRSPETSDEQDFWPSVQDALHCAEAGLRYLRMLVEVTRPYPPRFDGDEPPF